MMLNKNSVRRPSASECLNNKWFKIIKSATKYETIDRNILDNINKMGSKNKIQHAVYAFIVS